MAIRLRQINNYWVALCAVEADAALDDIYIDGVQDHTLRMLFMSENFSHEPDVFDITKDRLVRWRKPFGLYKKAIVHYFGDVTIWFKSDQAYALCNKFMIDYGVPGYDPDIASLMETQKLRSSMLST